MLVYQTRDVGICYLLLAPKSIRGTKLWKILKIPQVNFKIREGDVVLEDG